MNAITYIQQHGVEKAMEVVEGAPDGSEFYADCKSYGNTYVTSCQISYLDDIRDVVYGESAVFWKINLYDLKRLVESVDLVKEHYTLDRAKTYAASPYTAPELKERLEQAIADYEAIGGEHV